MIKKVDVKDNFLNNEVFNQIRDVFSDHVFPWYYSDVVNEEDKLSSTSYLDNSQLSHYLYSFNKPMSQYFEKMEPIFEPLYLLDNFVSLYRMKANMNPRRSKIIEHGFHNDVTFQCRTGILYLNTNDGYTCFEDGNKIESIENRFVAFDSSLKHSGTTCTDEPRRIVLNINLVEIKNEK